MSWFRLLFVSDVLGLALSVYMASQSVPFPKGQLLVALSGTLGLTYWFALQPKWALIPYNRYFKALACAPLAAVTALAIEASMRGYYSGTYLAKFTLVWIAAMLVSRGVVLLLQPRPRVMLIGESTFWAELRSLPQLRTSVQQHPPRSVSGWDWIVLDPAVTYDQNWLSWLAKVEMHGLPMLSAPVVLETLTGKISVEALQGARTTEVFRGRSNYGVMKRALDVAAVLVLLPALLALSLVVAVLVLADSGRPVLFWQERMGLNGRPFKMVKFRTMNVGAEMNGAAFAARDDHRVTRLGVFLRRFRLDELPQFWNVLIGDMSVIGPRPEQMGFARDFQKSIPLYELRHTVKPGITGWAQVSHGYASGSEETREKIRYDIYYVKHFSLWLDVRIVIMTLWTLLTGFGSR